jgi:hypothetical protein
MDHSMNRSEAVIQRDILVALNATGRCRVWRQNTGMATPPGSKRPVRFGVPGQADISGLVSGSGRRFELEVKRPGAKQSDTQRVFERVINDRGGYYGVATSVAEALAHLNRAYGVTA